MQAWLKLQQDEIKEIGQTLAEVMIRLDKTDETVRKRIESPEYLKLVKKRFRDWSAAESEEKRVLVRNLLTNAATGEKICGDDIISLFIEWVSKYSEKHFVIIREVYKNSGVTRFQMWQNIYGEEVREDSGAADLFELLIRNLSLGGVIRQHKETDGSGRFIKPRRRKTSSPSKYMKSRFDDKEEYELTELGEWFVHYTMNEIVPRIEGKK